MFDSSLIPQQNAQVKQALTNIYTSSGASSEQKAVIDKKLEKIDHVIKDKIASTVTISEYFDQLWTQPELKDTDKEFAIRKLEAIQQNKKLQIQQGEQPVAKSASNLDVVNAAFKMTAFEEYNLQEKIEEFKKKKKLDVKVTLNINSHPDPEVLHALNKASKSAKANTLHYTAGLLNGDEEEHVKIAKAEEFVKKIQTERKNFKQNIKEREMSVEKREQEDLERLKRKEKEEEERRLREKKEKLEAHIKELKHKNEDRKKESDKWEEEYRVYTAKKPLYREYEDKFKKSFVIPELEKRKEELKRIRDFHKPIAREELEEHEKKMVKALEELAAKKELQNAQKDGQQKNQTYKKPEFESKYHQKIVEEASKARGIKEHEQTEKLKKKERMMEYLQQVKEKHQPTADPAKELELLNLIEKLGKKKEPRSKTADDEERHESHIELRKKGNDYLQAVKEQVQEQVKRKKEKLQTTKDGIDDHNESGVNALHSVKSDTTFKKRNYLADLRRENKLIASPGGHLTSILKNKKLDNSERKELLQTEVEKLEEKAKRLELLRKHKAKKPTEGVEDDSEVDQIYINAIRAKLEMLGN